MNNQTGRDLIEIGIMISKMLSADELADMTRLNQECRDTSVRLGMVEEIECEIVAVLGKRAERDEELRSVLDLISATATVLRDELEATNEAISGIIKRVIHRTFGTQSIQNPCMIGPDFSPDAVNADDVESAGV